MVELPQYAPELSVRASVKRLVSGTLTPLPATLVPEAAAKSSSRCWRGFEPVRVTFARAGVAGNTVVPLTSVRTSYDRTHVRLALVWFMSPATATGTVLAPTISTRLAVGNSPPAPPTVRSRQNFSVFVPLLIPLDALRIEFPFRPA